MAMAEREVERPYTNLLFQKAVREGIPLSGTFELSPVCNFSCSMCYVRKTKAEVEASPRPILKLEDWLALAREAREAGLLYLLLTGGEPFLWPDFWTLYEQLYEMGFLLSINTNGSLITPEVVERLRQRPPTRINITLYGASDETYQALCGVNHVFQRVTEAILRLKEHHIPVKVNCSLTPHNIHDLERIVSFAEEHQLILSATPYMFPPLRRAPDRVGENDRFTPEEAGFWYLERYRLQSGEERYRRLLEELRKPFVPLGLDTGCADPVEGTMRCRAGRASFWVTWDGYMTPCGMMPEPKTDLRGKSFQAAWQETRSACEALRLTSRCGQCKGHELCQSCAAMALAETGTTQGVPTYLCRMVGEMQRIARAGAPTKATMADRETTAAFT